MTDEARVAAETMFQRTQRSEREISAALRLEQERHDAAIENMRRLRELRLSKGKAEAR